MPQTSSPKPKRETSRRSRNGTNFPQNKREEDAAKQKEEAAHKRSTSKDANRSGPNTVQHPSPMSRVHRVDSPVWVRAAAGNNADKQYYNKDNCGCHACIKELAVMKMLREIFPLGSETMWENCIFTPEKI